MGVKRQLRVNVYKGQLTIFCISLYVLTDTCIIGRKTGNWSSLHKMALGHNYYISGMWLPLLQDDLHDQIHVMEISTKKTMTSWASAEFNIHAEQTNTPREI